MTAHLTVLATLALAILFSPETLIVGLIIASDKKVPRQASLAFSLGAVVGIVFATGIGMWIAALTGMSEAPHHPSWPGFIVRVVIAVALLAIGLYRAVAALRHKPIADPTEPGYTPSRLREALAERFPGLARRLNPEVDLPVRQRIGRAGLIGFVVGGLHPKVFPIAIAAGHQLLAISDRSDRLVGIVVFAGIALVPAVAPTVIELVRPGAAGRIKEGYERLMKVHGRWLVAVLLIAAAAFVGHNAFDHMPR
ncbi:GAP family protein [Mycobacterium sp. DL592]|uniref:GAP family protein n=1 Tax=Mycobacterium sp. DL592 TaxID=2675524 RepID=UPI001422BB3E|nr:GAP family protein [Mycobacterium sp. DL592]